MSINNLSGWAEGNREVCFSAYVGETQVQLRVPRPMWLRAIEDGGMDDVGTFAMMPGRVLQLIEVEASHQMMLGNGIDDGVLTLRLRMARRLGGHA